MKMKKAFALLLCVALAFGTFGCTGSGGNSTGSTAQTTSTEENPFPPTSKTISVSWFTPWWMDASDFQYIFDEFARQYPDYKIEQNVVDDLPTLLASIQAGNQPDVWMGGDPNNTNFVSGCYQNLFTRLDNYLDKDPTLNLKTLEQSQMNLCKFNNGYYALPYLTSQFCIVYNKKLFAQAGIDPESPPKTWDEYYDYAKKLTKFDANGVVTQMGVIDGPYVYQMENCGGNSGSLMPNGIDSNMNSDWVLKVNQFCDKFDSIIGSSNSKPADVKFSLESGNAAMTANGNLNYLNSYAAAGVDFGVAKIPSVDSSMEQNIPSLLWYYFAIPKGAKNPNGGWLFAKYAMTEGLYQGVAKDFQKNPTGVFPQYIAHEGTRNRVYEDFVPNLSANLQNMIKERDALVQQELFIMPYSPIHSTFNSIQTKWAEKQTNGEVGLKEKLEGIHNEYQSTLDIWKKSMIAQGWQFPDGKAGIPPQNYDD